MNRVLKEIVRERFVAKQGGWHCGLCGDVKSIESNLLYLQLRIPTKPEDIITCCFECRKHVLHHRVEEFRNKIQNTIGLIVAQKESQYRLAVKFGMPKIEPLKVIFYYEKIS